MNIVSLICISVRQQRMLITKHLKPSHLRNNHKKKKKKKSKTAKDETPTQKQKQQNSNKVNKPQFGHEKESYTIFPIVLTFCSGSLFAFLGLSDTNEYIIKTAHKKNV
jgi:hypothetical protein